MAWFKTPEEEIRKSNPFYERDQQRYNFEGFFKRPEEKKEYRSALISSYVADFLSGRENDLERKIEQEKEDFREAWVPKPGHKGHLVVDAGVPIVGEVKPDPKQLSLFPNFYPERKIVHYEPKLFVPDPKKDQELILP